MGNFYLLVVDGLGVGAQEDAAEYGDESANTLVHVCEQTGCRLPNFQKLGLGNIVDLKTVAPNEAPLAATGKMREVSAGKDSTTGHWELAGLRLDRPFPTYPEGFPDEVIDSFCRQINVEKVLCNQPLSGTTAIAEFGAEHLQTGSPVVYTSADSVFQVAAHIEQVPLERLYEWCRLARNHVMVGQHGVGRVIARPFRGPPGAFERISEQRKDFSLSPPEHNVVYQLYRNGIKTYGIGKVIDLFAGEGFTQYRKTRANAEGISQMLSLMSAAEDSFVFVNLIDTDQIYGHRLDPDGYARSLQEIDRAIPAMANKIKDDDLLVITADHGNDPTAQSTDHSREFVPLLVFPGENAKRLNLGIRATFADVASSVAEYFGLEQNYPGSSFIKVK
ncbi:phosphopentomutase [Halalkalibaculum sp. DA384]|uniref:phosphopentomutase n=1 Tax=Halalkalibaculum sp. DA384 TaxID=3373606 RepID=UPI00375454EB